MKNQYGSLEHVSENQILVLGILIMNSLIAEKNWRVTHVDQATANVDRGDLQGWARK